MTNYITRDFNVETGEFVDRQMTENEIAQHQKFVNETLAQEKALEEKESARKALLLRLDITEEEAKLLLS